MTTFLLAARPNWVDLIVAVFLLVLAWRGLQAGLISGLLTLATFAAAFWLAVVVHEPAGVWLQIQTGLPTGLSQIVAFLALLIGGRLILGLLARQLESVIEAGLRWIRPLDWINRLAGVVPEVLLGSIALLAVLLVLSTVPISPPVAAAIQASWTGRNVLPWASGLVPTARDLLSTLPADQVPMLAPRIAAPEERIALTFPPGLPLSIDEAAESRLLALLNRERTERGLKPLRVDPAIVAAARAHGRDMFERGYFAHDSPDGRTPSDRLLRAGARFRLAGENLAYAPTVERAHEGLMNSPGHRANILRPEFGRVGIGAVQGGIFGTMFTQDFAD